MKALNKKSILKIFSDIDKNLQEEVVLVAIGSTATIMLDQPKRTTNDIDIWLPASKINNIFNFIKICELIGVKVIMPTEDYDFEEDIKQPYIQLISDESSIVVEFGQYDRNKLITLYKGNMLTVLSLPPENIIASKLIRCKTTDINDCIFLIKKFRITPEQIKNVTKTFKDKTDSEIAEENIVIMEVCGAFNYERQRIKDTFFAKKVKTHIKEKN